MRNPGNEISQQNRYLSRYEHVVSSKVKISVWLHAKLHANKMILQTRTEVKNRTSTTKFNSKLLTDCWKILPFNNKWF